MLHLYKVQDIVKLICACRSQELQLGRGILTGKREEAAKNLPYPNLSDVLGSVHVRQFTELYD